MKVTWQSKLSSENAGKLQKSASDKGDSACTLFMDLSKTFDTINPNLLLAKLKAYHLSKDALTLMCSYLKNSKQRVVINNSTNTTKPVAT